jgi:hypothetical protein
VHQDGIRFALSRNTRAPQSITAIGGTVVLDVVNNKVGAILDVLITNSLCHNVYVKLKSL